MAGESSFASVKSLVEGLDAAQEAPLIAYVEKWEAAETKHLRVAGGKDGVDLDYGRERAFLRLQTRVMLGLDPLSDADVAADPNVMQLVEISF
jgi:hypothetical protein